MEYDPNKITYFGKTDARGQNVTFGIKAADRTRHMYVIGKTGMGKSTLLENMAVQDITGGEGFAFIDPHGQTAETLLDYIPEERKDDVLYFAPFDTDNPVSFNVMEDVDPDKRHLVVSGLMSTFKKVWVDAWSARMEYILSNTLLALLEYPDSTLLGVNQMLSNPGYRKRVVDNVKDPAVKSFWVDEFAKYNERYMQEAGDSIKNKTGQFTANPVIRNIIGQPKSSFDVRTMMDERKILIMNLSKGLIGETNANLLGSMLITRIYLSAMSRADLSPTEMKEMPNFYFYVDEFQSFANETFANILSEARKYKLNLTIAHQYIEQMEEEVKNAVFGNVGTIISFRVGPFDAEVLETIFQPKFYATDIVNLGFAQVYLTLMIDGIGSLPFSAKTLPPIENSAVSCKNMVIASSRQKYTHNRAEVEERIDSFLQFIGTLDKNGQPRERRDDAKPQDNRGPREGQGKGPGSGNNRPRNGERTKWPEGSDNRAPFGDRLPKRDQGARPKPKPQSLDELRSVLKNISDETGGDAPRKNNERGLKPNQKKDTRPQKAEKKDEGGDLKGALADVLKNHTPEPKKEEKSEKPVRQAPRQKQERKQAPKTRDVREEKKPEPKKEEPKAEPQKETKSDDTISAKQLEKMMRVTTSDKPPLK